MKNEPDKEMEQDPLWGRRTHGGLLGIWATVKGTAQCTKFGVKIVLPAEAHPGRKFKCLSTCQPHGITGLSSCSLASA